MYLLYSQKNQIQNRSGNQREVELYFTADPLGKTAYNNLTITIRWTDLFHVIT